MGITVLSIHGKFHIIHKTIAGTRLLLCLHKSFVKFVQLATIYALIMTRLWKGSYIQGVLYCYIWDTLSIIT